MTIQEARAWAAQAWTDDKNSHKQMDSDLAESFAQILIKCLDNAETASKIMHARKIYRDLFALDLGPGGFYNAYLSNIAMLLHDQYGIVDYEIRNRAARAILNLLFGSPSREVSE